MIADLNFPIEMVVCPIVRESDRLAMSSRNSYLNPEERQAATVLSKSLMAAEKLYQGGEKRAFVLCRCVSDIVAAQPLAKLQYISCADAETLQEVETVERPALLSMAVYVGKTRLIDNLILKSVD